MCKRSFVIPSMGNENYREEEEGSVAYHTVLFCNCGQKEIVDLHAIPGYNREHVENLVRNERIICKKCGNQKHTTLYKGNYHHIFQDLQVFENGEKVTAAAMVGSYFIDDRTNTIRYVDNKFRITVNTTTGNTYFLKGKRIFNISNFNIPMRHQRLMSAFLNHYENNEEWTRFLHLCLKRRGIRYMKLEEFKVSYNDKYHFSKFFLFIKYPQLQNVKELPLTFLPRKVRKQIPFLTSKRDLYKAFFGTNNKDIFDFIFSDIERLKEEAKKESPRYLYHYGENKSNTSRAWQTLHVLSQAIKDPFNIFRALQLRQPYIVSRPFEKQFITEDDLPFGNDEEELFAGGYRNGERTEEAIEELDIQQADGKLLNLSSNDYSSEDVFEVEMFEEPKGTAYEMIDALQYFVKLFGETVFVNRIVKELTQYQDNKRHRLFYCKNNLYSILVDIHRMYQDIVIQNPAYKARWNKRSFRQIHDILSKDYARYCNETQTVIQYKKNELALEGELNETYAIKLAPHTKYLVDLGVEMDLCVGGYGKSAASKRLMIAVLYKEGKPFVCIEIQKKRIVQAKRHHNELPEEYDATLVALWAEENKLSWKHTSDLNNANPVLLKQLKKGHIELAS